eukprot:snap_masked-scaffold_35-processed-gene-0.21-mRNA-1 protein AED:1.00 eAED:1.00 QI:0/0/0/0/1/1/4/0/133
MTKKENRTIEYPPGTKIGLVYVPKCAICLKSMYNNLITLIICGHIFHYSCASKLSTRTNKISCPVCRKTCTSNPGYIKLFYDLDPEKVTVVSFEKVHEHSAEEIKVMKQKLRKLELLSEKFQEIIHQKKIRKS